MADPFEPVARYPVITPSFAEWEIYGRRRTVTERHGSTGSYRTVGRDAGDVVVKFGHVAW